MIVEEKMDRRCFLKTAMIAGVTLTLPDVLLPFPGNLHAIEKTDLVVARGPSPARITKAAVDGLGGIRRFISRGDVVVVKPNIGWDRTPEFAATTNPEVVSTIVRLCYEAGAKKVKVFDHSVVDPRRCYKQSGIADAARAAGAAVSYIDDRKFREVKLSGHALKSWPIYTEVLEADKVINMPIAKTHGLSTLTLGMKNWMGVMGGSRGRIHQRIDGSLVDVAMLIKPVLIVLDAVRILTANGPQGGDLSDVKRLNTVVIGTDQVAVDAFGATLFGLKGSDIGHIVAGHRAGLGTMELQKLKIKKIAL
ncbi:MAG: DUF362 domain-containing protein [Deltaproteobacteria bacterium]|nr:DUF362 domain-containing protein [Deltaproteobacteria bacterium]